MSPRTRNFTRSSTRSSKRPRVSASPSSSSARHLFEEDEAQELNFRDGDSKARFNSIINKRNIEIGKVIPPNFFTSEGLPINNLFQAIGWSNFLAINEPTYSTLLKLFYTHFLVINDTTISSYLYGEEISLSLKDLRRSLKIPKGDFEIYEKKAWPKLEGFDCVLAMNLICDSETITSPDHILSLSSLTLISRLIHKIITFNILPRLGSKQHISKMEVFLIWCVLKGVKIDLAFVILSHMRSCVGKTKGTLPFGMVFTRILKFQSIPLSGESIIPSKDTIFSVKLLHLMHLKKIEGNWVPVSIPQKQDVPSQIPSTSRPPRATTSANSQLLEQISAQIGQFLVNFDEKINSLSSTINAAIPCLESNVGSLSFTVAALERSYMNNVESTNNQLIEMNTRLDTLDFNMRRFTARGNDFYDLWNRRASYQEKLAMDTCLAINRLLQRAP